MAARSAFPFLRFIFRIFYGIFDVFHAFSQKKPPISALLPFCKLHSL